MASTTTTKVPYQPHTSESDSARHFNSLDTIISFDSETTNNTTSSEDTQQTQEQIRAMEAEQRVEALKKCLGGWRVAGGVLGLMMVFGWICIIAVLILEEKWQLVLVAWLLLYAAAHFCYWYFKRHSLLAFNTQVTPTPTFYLFIAVHTLAIS